jgi:hypothetical protein
MTIVEPAMIEAAQAAIFDTAVTQIGTPMGAVQSEETKRAVIVAEQDQLFAQDAYRQRRATARQLFHQGHRLPVAAQQITPRRAGAGLADENIFFARKHMSILDFRFAILDSWIVFTTIGLTSAIAGIQFCTV